MYSLSLSCLCMYRMASSVQVLQSLGGSGGSSHVCGHHVCHQMVLCSHHYYRCRGSLYGGADPQTRYVTVEPPIRDPLR